MRRFVHPDVTYRSALGFPLQIDPQDYFQACMLLGLYDPVGLAVARRFVKPGSVVVDIGAHFGYFSLELARLAGPCGEVHAFECDPRAAARLREHVRLAGATTVHVHEAALVEGSESEVSLRLTDQLGWSTIRRSHWVQARSEITVPAVGLDRALSRAGIDPARLSFLKADVEGAELLALRGGETALNAGSPAILVEFEPARTRSLGDDPAELFRFFAKLGYRPFRPHLDRRGDIHLEPVRSDTSGDLLFQRDGRASPAPQARSAARVATRR